MASGAVRRARGTFTGTGASLDILTIGFRPSIVRLYNRAGNVAYWSDCMADAAMHKRTNAGAGSFVTANGVTPLATGFRLGADTDLNVAAEVVDWEAMD